MYIDDLPIASQGYVGPRRPRSDSKRRKVRRTPDHTPEDERLLRDSAGPYRDIAAPRVRTLFLDIETSPNLAHVWNVYNPHISVNQLLESQQVLCFAYNWSDEVQVGFRSSFALGQEKMIKDAWELLDEADFVVHYNGRRFDIPHLNREFLLADLGPPAPYKNIDVYQTIKRQFSFPVKKLGFVNEKLGLASKAETGGHELWIKCLAGDPAAWEIIENYNKQDVVALKELYYKVRPWIQQHPSQAAFLQEFICPACGSSDLQRRGNAYTSVSKFQRYRCNNCGKWSRSTKRDSGVQITEVAA